MFDTHYDLLTKLYISYLRNDFDYVDNWIKYYNTENVTGLIANLCFESEKEMREDYDKDYYHPGDSVIEIFKTAVGLLKERLSENITVFTSIEGCDYLNDENDLVELKKLGLDAILPVWNCKNKFGSGNRSEDGLTSLGERLISKAVELGIGIDLSHTNEQTFWDIINYIKRNNLNAIVYASHSNSRSLAESKRNLTDEQIKAIVDLGGFVGLLSNSNFVEPGSYKQREARRGKPEYYEYIEHQKEKYIEHIKHVQELAGSVDNICVATDDMGFCEDPNLVECPIFNYETVAKDLRSKLVAAGYKEDEINKIMYENAISLLSKIREKNNQRVL